MMFRAALLHSTAARHFGKREAEAGLYSRRLGEARPRLGYPQGKPGPGGGIFLTETRQVALYLIGMAASATAGDAPAAVRAYANLPAQAERSLGGELGVLRGELAFVRALGFGEEAKPLEDRLARLEPLPLVFHYLRNAPHGFLDALVWLLDTARTEDGRERLRSSVVVTVQRSRREAEIVIDDRRAGERFAVLYGGEDGDEADRPDVSYPVQFTGRLLCDIGELLGTDGRPRAEPEHEDAPPTEASGASSVSRRPAKVGTRIGCEPRANADSPGRNTGECSAADTRFPPDPVGGSPPSSWPRRRGARCPTASPSPS